MMIDRDEPPYYAADTMVSMPEAPKHQPLISMYGFAYTQFGIVHDTNQTEIDELSVPRYTPYDGNMPVIRGDADLD